MSTKMQDAYLKKLQAQVAENKKHLSRIAGCARVVEEANEQLSATREKIESLMKDGDISSDAVTDQIIALKKEADGLVERIGVAEQKIESFEGSSATLLKGSEEVAEEIFGAEKRIVAEYIKGELSRILGSKSHFLGKVDDIAQSLSDEDVNMVNSFSFACRTRRNLEDATAILAQIEKSITKDGYCFQTTVGLLKSKPEAA